MAPSLLFLLLGLNRAFAELPSHGDGFTAEFFEGLAHDTFSAVFQGEARGRRLQTFVDGLRAERRRLDSTSDVATGQSSGAGGPTSNGVVKTVLEAQCSDESVSCMTLELEKDVCNAVKQTVVSFTQATTVNQCFCTECPAGAKFAEYVTKTINDMDDIKRKRDYTAMDLRSVDEIAGMCTHQPAMECVFGGKNPGCETLLTDMEKTFLPKGCAPGFGTGGQAAETKALAEGTCPTRREVITGVTLPALKCLCVDCNYADFASVISPIAKKIMTEKDLYPPMQEMAGAICQKASTVKCMLSGKDSCALPTKAQLGTSSEMLVAHAQLQEVEKQRDTVFASLDCLCTSCPKTMGKVMTLAEKVDKGVPMTETQKFQEMCNLYTDMSCFIQQDACRSAVLMLMGSVGPMLGPQAASVPTDAAEFKIFAEQQQQTLKAECSKQGITVVEYEESSEASFAQGLSFSLAPLVLLFAAYFVNI